MSQSSPGPAVPPRKRGGFLRVVAWAAIGVTGLLVLMVGCIGVLTKDVTSSGDRFLADMTGSSPALAWQSGGPALQQAVTQDRFAAWVAENRLGAGKVSFWSNRKRTNAEGVLEGTLTRPDGTTTPLRLVLRQNDAGAWQVVGLTLDPDGSAAAARGAVRAP